MEGDRGKRAVESLGWMTESSFMPKKIKAIEGVGAASILDLKAQLYRTQEDARKAKESPADFRRPIRSKPADKDRFSNKNAGVDSRNQRDKLEMKAVNDGSVSYAALEKKAELYDKLARGALPDEEENEKYCVDFFSKGFVQDESRQPEVHGASNGSPQEIDGGGTDNGSSGDHILNHILNSNLVGPGRKSGIVDRDEHKRFVLEAHEEANQERQKTTKIRTFRKQVLDAKREKFRQDFLKKKLEKLLSSKQTPGDS